VRPLPFGLGQTFIYLFRRTLNKVAERANHYKEMSRAMAFVLYQNISDEIKDLFGELDTCLGMFSVSAPLLRLQVLLIPCAQFASDVAQSQWVAEFSAVQKRESQELHQLLQVMMEKMDMNRDAIDHNQGQLLDRTSQIFDVLQHILNDKITVTSSRSVHVANAHPWYSV
jgi:hypothetical protein